MYLQALMRLEDDLQACTCLMASLPIDAAGLQERPENQQHVCRQWGGSGHCQRSLVCSCLKIVQGLCWCKCEEKVASTVERGQRKSDVASLFS